MLIVDTLELFNAFNCSAPAARVQGLSFCVCFKSVASFCHPEYLLRTSPRSIPCAWNSRIWLFYLNNTLLPRRNVWNLIFATLRPESMKLTCQFRRFLARTFRPVAYCKFNNYERNGNAAVPGLFIYSGGKQGGNCLEWRSRKKV